MARHVVLGVATLLCALAQSASTAEREPVYLTLLGQPEEFADEFPPSPADAARHIGFGALFYTLRTPIEEMTLEVERVLDTAERSGYPVLIHLDDWNYPSPSDDPRIVEWTAFPAPGEDHGPLCRRRWINWGSWFTVEPPPNTESPLFRTDMEQRVSAIAGPIGKRMARWRGEGREHLLAGVVVGWESGYYTAPPFDPAEPPRFGDEVFGPEEAVKTGYAALTARGHTAQTIAELARGEGKPESQVFHELMVDVVRDYTAFLAGVCLAQGIPRERIYTHFTGVGALPAEMVPPGLSEDGRTLPLWAAANENSRPGITATVPWTDVERAAAMFAEEGCAEWGAVEVEFTEFTRDEGPALAYLESLTAGGARVICVYGWWEPPGHPFAVRGTGAVEAMKRWLIGGP